MALRDRVAVVTGGARGMGRAIVEGLLAEGCKVAALDISWQGVETFKEALEARKEALALTADVVNEEHLMKAYRSTLEAFGTVDIIVNDAGYRQRNVVPLALIKVLDIPLEQWRRMLDVNATGPLLVIKHFIPPLLEKKAGSIVNVSSDSGIKGRLNNQPYGASKAAFTNWSQSLADEIKEFNIAVNIIYPAGTRTTGWEEQTRLREQFTGIKSTTTPYKPESIVPLALFLAQQDARVTGRIFEVVNWNLEHGLGGRETWGALD